jgi:hypothetical protein
MRRIESNRGARTEGAGNGAEGLHEGEEAADVVCLQEARDRGIARDEDDGAGFNTFARVVR